MYFFVTQHFRLGLLIIYINYLHTISCSVVHLYAFPPKKIWWCARCIQTSDIKWLNLNVGLPTVSRVVCTTVFRVCPFLFYFNFVPRVETCFCWGSVTFIKVVIKSVCVRPQGRVRIACINPWTVQNYLFLNVLKNKIAPNKSQLCW